MSDTVDTATLLDEAVIAHAASTGAIPPDAYVVGWTLVGEAIDAGRDDGVLTFTLRSETLDPILELGLLTMRQREAEDIVSHGDDDK